MWQGILNKVFKVREKVALNLGKEDEEKPFLEHLDDLRDMFVRIGVTLIIAVIGMFFFYQELFRAIRYPMILAGLADDQAGAEALLQNTDVAGPFMMAINVTLIAGVIISFPLLLIFVLQFILPGLRANEKKVLWPAIGIGTGLFLTGCTFAYWVVLPRALEFFDDFAATLGSRQDWTLSNYVTFTTRFILVFGIAFELPVIVMALVKLDFLNYKLMKSTWRHALIAITLFAAIITPTPDVLTLMLMSGPLYFLYGICIVLAYFMEKKDREAYPEYYAQIEKDEKELEEEVKDDWDNENYNPWFSEDKDDEEDEYHKPRPSAPPPEVEKAPNTVPMSTDPAPAPPDDEEPDHEDQGSSVPDEEDEPLVTGRGPETPREEKTTEELAREDEQRGGNP
ncbi:MAG TPA: twin-arginine translocase subunit TatC [Verrucomicrobiales bacterium]|nr:twin-arginine translocase subunit TatC [Verrucomicrobiales bacterium]HRJ09912.1 twin-arginine translocase subunit TatC [Prosthecobacter sp.]HRK16059.1 twin-arginine translocase subunit TatC [Prosthecobacter sp.]